MNAPLTRADLSTATTIEASIALRKWQDADRPALDDDDLDDADAEDFTGSDDDEPYMPYGRADWLACQRENGSSPYPGGSR